MREQTFQYFDFSKLLISISYRRGHWNVLKISVISDIFDRTCGGSRAHSLCANHIKNDGTYNAVISATTSRRRSCLIVTSQIHPRSFSSATVSPVRLLRLFIASLSSIVPPKPNFIPFHLSNVCRTDLSAAKHADALFVMDRGDGETDLAEYCKREKIPHILFPHFGAALNVVKAIVEDTKTVQEALAAGKAE